VFRLRKIPTQHGRAVHWRNIMSVEKRLSIIVLETQRVIQRIIENDGELDDELEGMVEKVKSEITYKTDNYGIVLEQLKMNQEYWDKKAKEAKRVANGFKRLREGLRTNMKLAMEELKVEEIKGIDTRFVLFKQGKSLEIDRKLLPDCYIRVEQQFVPDEELIKADLDTGLEIPGAGYKQIKVMKQYPNIDDRKGTKNDTTISKKKVRSKKTRASATKIDTA